MKRALLLALVAVTASACAGRNQKGSNIQRTYDDSAEHRAPDAGGERAIGQR